MPRRRHGGSWRRGKQEKGTHLEFLLLSPAGSAAESIMHSSLGIEESSCVLFFAPLFCPLFCPLFLLRNKMVYLPFPAFWTPCHAARYAPPRSQATRSSSSLGRWLSVSGVSWLFPDSLPSRSGKAQVACECSAESGYAAPQPSPPQQRNQSGAAHARKTCSLYPGVFGITTGFHLEL